jgi:hypothetical protein
MDTSAWEANMQRALSVALVTLGLAFSQTKLRRESVTVTGCIYQGVECLILKNLKGKRDYSLVRTNNLQVGHSYQITGPVSEVGTCQEGKPILTAKLVHELRLRCEPPTKKDSDFAEPTRPDHSLN